MTKLYSSLLAKGPIFMSRIPSYRGEFFRRFLDLLKPSLPNTCWEGRHFGLGFWGPIISTQGVSYIYIYLSYIHVFLFILLQRWFIQYWCFLIEKTRESRQQMVLTNTPGHISLYTLCWTRGRKQSCLWLAEQFLVVSTASFDLRTSYTFTEMDKETAVHLVKSVDDGMLYHLLYIILAEIQERCYVYRAPGCQPPSCQPVMKVTVNFLKSLKVVTAVAAAMKAMKVKVFFGILPWDLVSHVHLHKFGDLEEYSWVLSFFLSILAKQIQEFWCMEAWNALQLRIIPYKNPGDLSQSNSFFWGSSCIPRVSGFDWYKGLNNPFSRTSRTDSWILRDFFHTQKRVTIYSPCRLKVKDLEERFRVFRHFGSTWSS